MSNFLFQTKFYRFLIFRYSQTEIKNKRGKYKIVEKKIKGVNLV